MAHVHSEAESLRENLLTNKTSSSRRTEGENGRYEHGKVVLRDYFAGHGDLERQKGVASIPTGGARGSDGTGTSPADSAGGSQAGALPPSSPVTGLQVVLLAACMLLLGVLCACTKEPPIREKLYGLIEVNVSSGCHGLVGGASLIAGQLALGASKRPWATEAADEASRELIRRAYGRKPRVAAVIAIQLCWGLVLFAGIEMAFRGMLPLVLAAKTGAPTAVVVALSSATYGIIVWLLKHCPSRWVLVSSTVVGAWMHGLVLLTGSIFVPIVAHLVYDMFFSTLAHVQATRPPHGVEMAPREQ